MGIMPRMALKDTLKKGSRPPKLRSGNAKTRCGVCVHFRGAHRQGTCQLYRWPVQATQMCDSFETKETA